MKTHLPLSRLFLFFCAVAGAFAFSGCNSVKYYRQVTTFDSPEVKMQDNGTFAYKTDEFMITYDLWAENGEMTFSIVNFTDTVLLVDMTQSFFVVNGHALDYYQARTFGSANSRTNSGSYSSNASLNYADATGWNYMNTAYAFGSSFGVSNNSTSGYSRSTSSYVEYEEQKIIVIPAKTYKIFSEFKISSTLYRSCGRALDPDNREVFGVTYTKDDTPLTLRNSLNLIVNGLPVQVENNFYASMIANMNMNNFEKYNDNTNCKGNVVSSYKVARYYKPNRMYVKYSSNDFNGNDNDRTKESKKYNIKPKDDYRRPGTEESKTNRQNNGNYDFLWY